MAKKKMSLSDFQIKGIPSVADMLAAHAKREKEQAKLEELAGTASSATKPA